MVVFASSTGGPYSPGSWGWKNGPFTKALVEAVMGQADMFKSGRLTHTMLARYVYDRMRQLTKGQQMLIGRSPDGVPDFAIALMK